MQDVISQGLACQIVRWQMSQDATVVAKLGVPFVDADVVRRRTGRRLEGGPHGAGRRIQTQNVEGEMG